MKFKINQRVLNNALATVQKGVATRTTMEILKGIYFKVENKKLVLTTNNLEVSIQTSVECETYSQGYFVIDAKIITDIVKKLENDIIHFETVENTDFINIRCNNSNFNIKTIKCDEFPMPSYIDERRFTEMDSKVFEDLVFKSDYVINQNAPNPLFANHFVNIEQNKITMFSIDGFRLAVVSRIFNDTNFEEKQIILKGQTLSDMARLIDEKTDTIHFGYDEKHTCLITPNTVFTCCLTAGEFLDYKSLLKIEPKTTVKVETSRLKSAIERIALLSKDKLIKFTIEDFMMEIASNNDTLGNATEFVDIESTGPKIEIAFSSDYILDTLKHIEDQYVILKLQDPLTGIIISPEFDQDYINLILPVRLK